jgi:hypothetical protein
MDKPNVSSERSSNEMSAESQGQKGNSVVEVSSIPADGSTNEDSTLVTVPLSFKLASILLVSAIGFGSSWSGGITGAMKTTLKKVFPCLLPTAFDQPELNLTGPQNQ